MDVVRYLVFLVSCIWLLEGCAFSTPGNTSDKDRGAVSDSIGEQSPTGEALFEKDTHDFGTIWQGDEVSVRFYFSNGGSQPLVIENVDTGCGCTMVHYPRKPILKGERKWVEVIFNSQGRMGLQYQEVTVRFAHSNKKAILTIVGQVREK